MARKSEAKASAKVQVPQPKAPSFSMSFLESPQSTRFPQGGPATAQATPWQSIRVASATGFRPRSTSMARKDDGKSWMSAPFIMERAHRALSVVNFRQSIPSRGTAGGMLWILLDSGCAGGSPAGPQA